GVGEAPFSWSVRSGVVPGAGAGLGPAAWNFDGSPVAESAATPPDASGALTVLAAGAAADPAPIPRPRGNDVRTAVAMNRKIAAPLANVVSVRSGASHIGT